MCIQSALDVANIQTYTIVAIFFQSPNHLDWVKYSLFGITYIMPVLIAFKRFKINYVQKEMIYWEQRHIKPLVKRTVI